MFKINELAVLSGIPIYKIKYLLENELLIPAEIYDNTVLFSTRELSQVKAITSLMNIGYGMNTIKKIFKEYTTEEELETFYKTIIEQKTEDKEKINNQIEIVENLICQEYKNEYTIDLMDIPARSIVSRRERISNLDHESELWISLSNIIASNNLKVANPGRANTIYHSIDVFNNEYEIEVCRTLDPKQEYIKNDNTKEVDFMKVIVVSSFDSIDNRDEVYKIAAEWLEDSEYEICGELFSSYLVERTTPINEGYNTPDICFPVRKKLNSN